MASTGYAEAWRYSIKTLEEKLTELSDGLFERTTPIDPADCMTAVCADALAAVGRRRRPGQVVAAAALAVVLATGAIAAITANAQRGGNRVRTIDSGRGATRPNPEPVLGIQSVVGRIVAVSRGSFEKTITLDRGTERGVRVGMPVVASDSLVGRVVQAWKDGSKVLLLDDPTFAVGVRIVSGRAMGVAQGEVARSTLDLNIGGPLAPSNLPLKHDLAETSGLQGSMFPRGIPVGRVDTVKVSGDGLSINVRLIPLVRVAALKHVNVVLWTAGSRADSTTPVTAGPVGSAPEGVISEAEVRAAFDSDLACLASHGVDTTGSAVTIVGNDIAAHIVARPSSVSGLNRLDEISQQCGANWVAVNGAWIAQHPRQTPAHSTR